MKLAFIGLGAMGYPMAGHLARAFKTFIWNRNLEKSENHARAFGSQVASSITRAVEQADIVFTCLPTTKEVLEVLPEIKTARAGTVWIDCTSGHPDDLPAILNALEGTGIHFLDAPLSGGTLGAINARLTVMVGGDVDAFERVLPVLEKVAAKIVRVGDSGAGYAVKAINNMLLAVNLWAAGEGLVTLASNGVNLSAALEVINASSGRSNASENLIPQRVLTRAFPATFKLGLLSKDAGIAGDVVRASSASTPLFALTEMLFKTAKLEVGADEDHTAALKLLERWAGVEIVG